MDCTADYPSIYRQIDVNRNIDWLLDRQIKKCENYGRMTARSQIEAFVRTIEKTAKDAFLIEKEGIPYKVKSPKLAFFYPYINRFLSEYSDQYHYSPRIKLFLKGLEALGITPGFFEFQKPLQIDPGSGERYGGLFNQLIQSVRQFGRQRKFKTALKAYEQTVRRREAKGVMWEHNLFDWHSRQVFVLLHLGYKEAYRPQITPEMIQGHRDALLENRRMNKLLRGINGYIWKLEDGEQTGLHMHVLIAYREDANSAIHVADQIGQYWERVVTGGIGRAWNGNIGKLKNGEERGLGKIDSYEMGKREALRKRIRYLTKSDQYLKCKHLVGLHVIGMSRPKQKVKQGRPRVKGVLSCPLPAVAAR